METLETKRMILRPLELADAAQAQQIFAQWEVVRFMNSRYIPWPYPVDGVLTYYREVALPAIERGEEWHWTLRLKSDPELLIGSISLRNREGHNRGFWLGLDWQAKGLMTEAVDAVTEYWFDVLGFPVLRASKAVANVASRKISERSGMRVVATEETEYVGGRFPTEIWEITAQEWRARRGGRR
jgi:ribosomal-protein-alanine N-acetyltransferase